MARFVHIFALCVVFVTWMDTYAQIAGSRMLRPSPFLTPSITETTLSKKTSSIKPSNASSIKPSNISSIKPFNSSSIKASNTSSIKPSNTSSIKPFNSSSIKPSNASSIKPSNISSIFTLTSIHNMTVTPHSTATPSNKTVLPVHNTTVVSSHITMTIKPSSAHSVMPTSSVSPSPPPPQGNFSVKQNGSVCLIADMEVVFNVSYMKNNSLEKVIVPLPSNANVSGECKSNQSSIVLMWPPGKNQFQFALYFSQSSAIEKSKSGAWVMDHLKLIIFTENNTHFPGAKGPNITFTSKSQLKGPLGEAYRCVHGVLQYNINNTKTQFANIKIKNFEFQPFGVINGTFSDNVQRCPEDNPAKTTSAPSPTKGEKKSNKTVAIAVGCALAGLVIIVLVGYLIGRRRSRSQAGYRKL